MAYVDPSDPNDTVYWPKDLLLNTIKSSRIFSLGYLTEFATFYPLIPGPVTHTTIKHHSTSLILKLSNIRRDTHSTTRPIIFVANSLGGLVVANALAGKYNTDPQGKAVVEHTHGTIFLGTPFKGSDKAPWAAMAKNLLEWAGSDTNDKTIKDLDKRSAKLQQISLGFHMLLQHRLASKDLPPIQVACFFEEIKTKKTWMKISKDLGHIVNEDSATLAGNKPIAINADHVTMCRFTTEESTGYKLVTGKIKDMIANFSKSTDTLVRESQTVVNFGDINMGSDNVNIGGYLAAVVMGTTENAVKMEIHINE